MSDRIVDLYNPPVPAEIASQSWRDLNKIVVFDVETTGVDWNDKDFRIIQFTAGMYNIEEDSEIEFLNEYIDPQLPVPKGAMEVHGIYQGDENADSIIKKHGQIDVSDKRRFDQKLEKIFSFMNNADLWCAYNHEFDVNAFAAEMERCGYNHFWKPTIDPLVFERERKQKFSGTTLWDTAKDYGVATVSEDDLHDAKADVLLLKDILKKMGGALPQSVKSLFRQQTGYLKKQDKWSEKRWG